MRELSLLYSIVIIELASYCGQLIFYFQLISSLAIGLDDTYTNQEIKDTCQQSDIAEM